MYNLDAHLVKKKKKNSYNSFFGCEPSPIAPPKLHLIELKILFTNLLHKVTMLWEKVKTRLIIFSLVVMIKILILIYYFSNSFAI